MLHFFKKSHRIGLDIDEVCADFLGGYAEKFDANYKEAKHFYFSYQTMPNLLSLEEDWWENLPAKVDGAKLPFLPACYISKRTFDVKITERWLEKNHFPCVPVIHVDGSKIEACKSMNVDIYVDDFIRNFQELNAAGITTFLMDCVHNRQYNVEDYRLDKLESLPEKIMKLGL